jgi:hypothetical protein
MNPPDASTPVRRSDWRMAMAWISERRSRVVFVVLVLVVAGLSSALGLLRWQVALARWSFAALCWGLALLVTLNGRRHRTLPSRRARNHQAL